MKIKQVCEATGLTDRAVRYYIEEGLIAPRYTENYLGRKAFDFSEDDAQRTCSSAGSARRTSSARRKPPISTITAHGTTTLQRKTRGSASFFPIR